MSEPTKAKENPTIEELHIMKTASCPSLSGKSTLTYQISCSSDKAVNISIKKNSGGGLFSKKLISLSEITPLLNSDQITSGTLKPAFKGTSANTAGFILAVLLNESIIKLISETPRKYQLNDLTGFNKQMQALMAAEPTKHTKVKEKKKEAQSEESSA